MSQPLRVLVGDERGRPAAAPGLARWLAGVAPSRVRGTVNIAMVSDAKVRELNRRYRGVDQATDVLSFPVNGVVQENGVAQDLSPALPSSSQSPAPSPLLGDIVIARGVARRQARAARHSEGIELRVLALHGLLHLIGYDHERDGGRMGRVEQRLRRKGRLREGLIERAGAPKATLAALVPPARRRGTAKLAQDNKRRRGRRVRNR